MNQLHIKDGLVRACVLAMIASFPGALGTPSSVGAQWSTTYESVYLPGSFNWQFREHYPAADRLFNAFDYGHAILYERLWNEPTAPVSRLEDKEYAFITQRLLTNPPNVPLEEAAIEIAYAKLVPEAKAMFDWAHLFHRQVYDVWADERIPAGQKDAKIAELLRYYRSRRDLAFSSQPKTMELMEGQPYSLAFRQRYPKFNGLIWAYHWLQVGLYEPLVVGRNKDERQTGVLAAVARFRQMIEDPPARMPRVMPMTAAVSPTFATRYPEAAIIFDNLHGMHDVVSDILANPAVPRNEKRARILEAARRYRDATSYVMTPAEWREMATMMGVQNMGGPAVGVLAPLPEPNVAQGAAMAGMDHARRDTAAKRDSSAAHPEHHPPAAAVADSARARPDTMRAMDHSKMNMAPHADTAARQTTDASLLELSMRMLEDPVIRKRLLADTAMRRLMTELISGLPPEHRAHMEALMREPEAVPAKPSTAAKKPASPRKPAAKRPAPKPAAKDSVPAMDHSKMPGMKKP